MFTPELQHIDLKKDQLYIQVGAYRSKENALSQQKKIRALTPEKVTIKQTQRNNKPLYRVIIHQIKSITNTEKLIQQLSSQNISYSIHH